MNGWGGILWLIVRETNDEEPKLVVYQQKPKSKIAYWILPLEWVDSHRYEFYIPEGSVKPEFNMDLQ